MRHDVYITRKEDWSDIDGPEITLDEWVAFVFADNSLEIDPHKAAAEDPRVASGAKEATHAIWTNWPARQAGIDEAWVWLERGNLVATGADTTFRRKLFLIADGLDACLMGENGEFFNSSGDPGASRPRARPAGKKRRWWKLW